jgi:pullulanase
MHVNEPMTSISPKGFPLATLELAVPEGHVGKTVIATLRINGRIIAQGKSHVSKFNDVRLILLTSEYDTHRSIGDYELWVTLDQDGLESWYPGFTDLYINQSWPIHDGPWKQFTDPSIWKEKILSSPNNRLRIHYHRYGGYYDGIGLWTWNPNSEKPPVEIFEIGWDEFGLIFELDKANYGDIMDNLRIGVLPRRGGDWNLKEDDNKYWDHSFGNEIFLIGTVNHIWKERPDTKQHVMAAFIDNLYCMSIQVSRPVDPGEVNADSIFILDENNQRNKVKHITHGDKPSTIITAITQDALDVGTHSYTAHLEHFGGNVVASLRDILHDADLFYDADISLGAIYSPASTTFRLFAPTAYIVEALVYDTLNGNNVPRWTVPMKKIGKGIFEGVQNGDMAGKYYLYRLQGPGFTADNKVLDPYAINTVAGSQYARITNLLNTNPPEWQRLREGPSIDSPVDIVIYEMSVRDFTIAANSGVTHKGSYLGFTESNTRLPEDSNTMTGLDHLQELGITHVQLMPVQDFYKDADEDVYNWGYMTVAFNSPEGCYATNKHNDSSIRELKLLVSALHARNIGVIMDVVYNHTDYSAPFHIINAQYYYRFFPENGYANGSGVGNDFRTECPMVRKFIIDSLKYWVTEYGIDGFRFDLMALIDFDTMQAVESELKKIKPDIILYGEPWSSGYSPIKGHPTDKHVIRNTSIGAFNDHFRNALGGSPNGSELGFIQNGSNREKLSLGMEGSLRDWAAQPSQSINYITCHDNLVLYDKLRWFNPIASEMDIIRMMKLGYLVLFTSQGVPFLHSGEEFARTKFGHGNSYNAGDEINRINWSLKAKHIDLYTYTRDLISLRKEHPLFRLRSAEQINHRVKTQILPNEKGLIYLIDGIDLEGETWGEACVLINGEETVDVDFLLPIGRWHVAFDELGGVAEPYLVEFRVNVHRKSGLVLYRVEEQPAIPETIPEAIVEKAPVIVELEKAEADEILVSKTNNTEKNQNLLDDSAGQTLKHQS